jgi:23S rRNA (guanosine2251-2'-O)-methyltransferase
MVKESKNEWFWVGGKHACIEIIKNKERKIKKIICTSEFIQKNKINADFKIVSREVINNCFNDNNFSHQGVALLVKKKNIQSIKNFDLNNKEVKTILILDQVSDQRNIGSIIRNCLAFKVDCIIIDKRFIKQNSYLLLKSASGAFEKQRIIETSNIKNDIKFLKKKNFWIYGLEVNSKKYLDEIKIPDKIAFVVGSEGYGLKKTVSNILDNKIKIRINEDIESLNVSNAVASLLTLVNYKRKFS